MFSVRRAQDLRHVLLEAVRLLAIQTTVAVREEEICGHVDLQMHLFSEASLSSQVEDQEFYFIKVNQCYKARVTWSEAKQNKKLTATGLERMRRKINTKT